MAERQGWVGGKFRPTRIRSRLFRGDSKDEERPWVGERLGVQWKGKRRRRDVRRFQERFQLTRKSRIVKSNFAGKFDVLSFLFPLFDLCFGLRSVWSPPLLSDSENRGCLVDHECGSDVLNLCFELPNTYRVCARTFTKEKYSLY